MVLIEDKGSLFDYKHQYPALIMLGTMQNRACKAELDEQARLFKNMNDLYEKFVSNTPCADQTGTGYFFFVPFDSASKPTAFKTLREAFMILREVGVENIAIKVCGTDDETAEVRKFLADYDLNDAPLGDVMLLI